MAEKRLKRMREQRFLDHIHDNLQAGQRYCFVLGAGASKASGIRTGEELMREWQKYLMERGPEYIADCAQELEMDTKDYKDIFEVEHTLKNTDYFTLFDLRFAGKPNAAYKYLEDEMEGKYPSYGYYPLATILSQTDNRLVITTNFDSLIEDALYTYTFRHPLVVGHESMASYIANDTRHPVIAKIHRDLLFRPLNRKVEMDKLKEEWKEPLRNALTRYIPIVIGYAGGDRTFMSLLDEIKLKGLYWCHLGEPSDEIKRIVKKQNGYLVKILGFDEIMFQLQKQFIQETKASDPCEYIRNQAEKRCELYEQSVRDIQRKYELQKDAPTPPSYSGEMRDDALRFAGDFDQYVGRTSNDAAGGDAKEKELVRDAQAALVNDDYEKAIELYGQAIALAPDNVEYYSKRSVAFYNLKQYEESLRDDTKVIELEPSKPEHYHSRGITLHAMERYQEALKDKNKAIQLDPSNSEYYNSRGVTLHAMQHYEESLKDKNKAIELDVSNALYYHNRGVTLLELKRYEEALRDANEAVRLRPSEAGYYNGRAVALAMMHRHEEALQDYNKAIELSPLIPLFYKNRAISLRALGRTAEAEQDEAKAKELEQQ